MGHVVRELLALRGDGGEVLLDDLVVCDNASSDATARVAREAGARVVREERRGYGAACLAGIAALRPVDTVLFADADHSDHPPEALALLEAIDEGADLAVGSRVRGHVEPGAFTPPQRLGNALASFLIRRLWGHPTTDLGPFRAIRREVLEALAMTDRTYGWTVEMQVKAIQAGFRVVEVPASYRRRIGRSKISGTVRGTVGAGWKILTTIGRLALRGRGARGRRIPR